MYKLKPIQLLNSIPCLAVLVMWLFSAATVRSETVYPITEDTVKYQGYRLHLTNFEVLKSTDDWVKLKCTIINSGRNEVDFSKKGTEHWVQVNFDASLFDNKLGGLRENIRRAMYDENLQIAAGEILRDKTLKVSVVIAEKENDPAEEIYPGFTTSVSTKEEPGPVAAFSAKGGDETTFPEPVKPETTESECPDIYFSSLLILEQDDKWATLEYVIENKGKGIFQLYDADSEHKAQLALRAYISGVAVLSRGALPIGGEIVQIAPGEPKALYPGGKYTGKIKLDVRKKTRYLKSLILSLESDQFHRECDKTNNTGAVILD